jgi:hypothetical protein
VKLDQGTFLVCPIAHTFLLSPLLMLYMCPLGGVHRTTLC